MKNCTECNNEFILQNRLKAITKRHGDLKCTNCKTTYRQVLNIYKAIFISLITILSIKITALIDFADNNLIRNSIIIISIITASILFDLIPNNYQKYEKYNSK